MVSRLLKDILVSPEADSSKGNLILNLSYGRKDSIISSMYSSKICDILFSLASSINNKEIFGKNSMNIPVIFEDIFCIIASIFECVDLKQLLNANSKTSKLIENDQKSFKKPIRHGKFSGSVSVQLSVNFLNYDFSVS